MTKDKLGIFNDIYNKYHKRCIAFAMSYTHDEKISEDIASEVMLKIWEILGDIQISNIQSFLLTSVKNLCLNHLQQEQMKNKVHSQMTDLLDRELQMRITSLESCNPDIIFTEEIQLLYQQTLDSLPEQSRRIFELSRKQNLSNKEIAELAGISVKGVDYHIAKSLKALRIALKDYLPFVLLMY